MAIKRYDNGYSDISNVKRYYDGAWTDCDTAKAYKNDAWEIVWQKNTEPEKIYYKLSNLHPSEHEKLTSQGIFINTGTTHGSNYKYRDISADANAAYDGDYTITVDFPYGANLYDSNMRGGKFSFAMLNHTDSYTFVMTVEITYTDGTVTSKSVTYTRTGGDKIIRFANKPISRIVATAKYSGSPEKYNIGVDLFSGPSYPSTSDPTYEFIRLE